MALLNTTRDIADQGAKPARPTNLWVASTSNEIEFFRMQAWDITSSVWRTWVVTREPDPTAAQYTGPFGGGSINFNPAFIAATWRSETL